MLGDDDRDFEQVGWTISAQATEDSEAAEGAGFLARVAAAGVGDTGSVPSCHVKWTAVDVVDDEVDLVFALGRLLYQNRVLY